MIHHQCMLLNPKVAQLYCIAKLQISQFRCKGKINIASQHKMLAQKQLVTRIFIQCIVSRYNHEPQILYIAFLYHLSENCLKYD